jgi:preprotein translocase subunit SecA
MSAPILRELERHVYLDVIDEHWMDHLREMDHMRDGIGLRAYGQRDPLLEYKREAFAMFEELTRSIREETVRTLYRAALVLEPTAARDPGRPVAERPGVRLSAGALPGAAPPPRVRVGRGDGEGGRHGVRTPAQEGRKEGPRPAPSATEEFKVGRNDPCPCGSGKKYKKCHGA